MFGDTIDRITMIDPLTGETLSEPSELLIFPATHYVAGDDRLRKAIRGIEDELQQQLALFESQGKLLEAQRLRMRTQYDLEMIQEMGYCNGIENYSMHIDGRQPGEPPFTLLDYFPKDFLLSYMLNSPETEVVKTRWWNMVSVCPVHATTGRFASKKLSSALTNASSCRLHLRRLN